MGYSPFHEIKRSAGHGRVQDAPSASRPLRVRLPCRGRGRVAAVLPPPPSFGSGFSAELTGVSFDEVAAPPSDLATFELRSIALGIPRQRGTTMCVPAAGATYTRWTGSRDLKRTAARKTILG
jgi:hypothetical protein